MKTKGALLFLTAFLCLDLCASLSIARGMEGNCPNVTDKKGRKQGLWCKPSTGSGLTYQGAFKDDMPTGKFSYWNAGDTLVAEAFYFREGYASYNRFYYPDGSLMADGYYLDKQKDSLWRYFAADGRLLKSETFENGLLNGARTIYTDSGTVNEKQTWFRGLRNGPWFIHDEAGYQIYSYKLNLSDGPYLALYPDSTRFVEGFYADGNKQNLWRFYLPGKDGADGDLYKEDIYKSNVLVSRILYLRIDNELRAVNMDTIPLVMQNPRGGRAEILTLSGRRYLCAEKFETVCSIFDLDFYFYANKNTLVAYSAVDEKQLPMLFDEDGPEPEIYDGQKENALDEDGGIGTGSGRHLRVPLKTETPFPVYLDQNGKSVLRNNFKQGEVADE